MFPAFVYMASSVASHSCALCSLLSIDKNVQECDATGDATCYIVGYKIFFILLRMKFFRRIILLLILCVVAYNVFAQANGIVKKRFPVLSLNYENGLIDNSTGSIITDNAGYTWVATFTGLQRYNGYKLQTVNPVVGKDTFYINYTAHLFALADGNILIAIKNGILKYDAATNKFSVFVMYKNAHVAHFTLLPLKETQEGIWCMQQNKGIALYDKLGNIKQQFSFFDTQTINEILQCENQFYAEMVSCSDKYIYILSLSKKILCINMAAKSAAVMDGSPNLLAVGCLHNKVFLTEANSITVVDDNGFGKRKRIALDSSENITGAGFKRADDDHLYFTRNQHLYLLDTSGKIDYEFTDRDEKSFIKNGNIQKVYPDKFNRIWILSNNDIKRIENAELFFQNFTYPDKQNNFIRSLYYDTQKNVLYAGGYDGMIQAYDTLGKPLWPKPLISKVGQYVIGIEKLTDDEYLIMCSNKGAFIFNAERKKIFPLKTTLQKDSLQNAITSYTNTLKRIDDSTLFIETSTNVFKCIFRNGVLTSNYPLFADLSYRALNCFLYTADSILWAGTNNGLLFVKNGDNLKTIAVPGSYIIRCITENAYHQICVGTEKGLYIYDAGGKLVKKIDNASGLRNDCIYAIIAVGKQLLVSTNLGISYINDDGNIQNFSREMGLQDNEFNSNAVLLITSGKLFFGGISGITAFRPLSFSTIKDTPQIHITNLTVNDVSFNSSSGIWFGDTIQLSYKQNNLHFDIAALGFFNADEYFYQYRIKQLDSLWEKSNNLSGINYTLPPGKYVLEVKCHPALSPDQITLKNFVIIITPPWWQTWWFIILAFVLMIFSIYLIIYQYNRKKYIAKIQALETQQQIQNERERISRELHDNIGSQLSFIISNIDWAIENKQQLDKEDEKKNLSHINDTARNVMSNLRESIWALNKETISFEEFADKLKAYIQNITALKRSMQFISEENISYNILFQPIDALNIFRICQECISNVIKHSKATILTLTIHSSSFNNFEIVIEDNGKGFDVEQNISEHYGLENIKHRAAELNAGIRIESVISKGTKITIYK